MKRQTWQGPDRPHIDETFSQTPENIAAMNHYLEQKRKLAVYNKRAEALLKRLDASPVVDAFQSRYSDQDLTASLPEHCRLVYFNERSNGRAGGTRGSVPPIIECTDPKTGDVSYPTKESLESLWFGKTDAHWSKDTDVQPTNSWALPDDVAFDKSLDELSSNVWDHQMSTKESPKTVSPKTYGNPIRMQTMSRKQASSKHVIRAAGNGGSTDDASKGSCDMVSFDVAVGIAAATVFLFILISILIVWLGSLWIGTSEPKGYEKVSTSSSEIEMTKTSALPTSPMPVLQADA